MLNEILEAKKRRLAAQMEKLPLETVTNRASLAAAPRNFRQALLGQGLSIIAEIKKASPSAGDINPNLDVSETAALYEKAGAAAISVLTEEDYFKGHSNYVKEVKAASRLPVLRKDFILDKYQVYESRLIGADAVLLIATILESSVLNQLVDLALRLNIEPLVEVHTSEDVDKALKTKAKVIGINNRNLKTFQTDLTVTEKLFPLIDKGRVVVSESGIRSAADAEYVRDLGVDAILVGESLVRAENVNQKLTSLRGA